jgi:hypothetical protein
VRLTTSPCRNKFVENLLRKKILEEAHFWAVLPLMMMMMMTSNILQTEEKYLHGAMSIFKRYLTLSW